MKSEVSTLPFEAGWEQDGGGKCFIIQKYQVMFHVSIYSLPLYLFVFSFNSIAITAYFGPTLEKLKEHIVEVLKFI